jgi:hypothetical protein
MTNNVMGERFPVALCNHFRICPYDDCEKCSEYIKFIHEWQKKNPEKMIRRTICDLRGLTNKQYLELDIE